MQMYDSNHLLSSLVQLGTWFLEEAAHDQNVLDLAQAQNGWFTPESVQLAFQSHGQSLSAEGVDDWAGAYNLPEQSSGLTVGLILAGNLPLVGWHDILCAVLAGHEVHVKLSSDDAVLPRMVVAKWAEFAPYVAQAVTFHESRMPQLDAVVCTGGANASRYFEAYFGHLPHVFRGPRTSVAVLDGQETEADLDALGDDIFAHFGMGCRSVTKVWLPEGFDLDRCFAQWVRWGHLGQHGKYANNYDYHKAVWLLNKEDMIENGFLLVKVDEALVSPIGTLFVERYSDPAAVAQNLVSRSGELQVVTARAGSELKSTLEAGGLRVTALGSNQCPSLTDYADGVDTMDFLLTLPKPSSHA